MNKTWLPHEDEYIKSNLDKSGKDLANHLNRSRCSVLGRIHRMGWRELGTYVDVSPKKKKRTQPSKNGFNGNVSLFDIQNGQCRYSEDEGKEMMCCGDRVHKQYSYCEKHCNVMFREGWEKIRPIKPRPEWREGIFY